MRSRQNTPELLLMEEMSPRLCIAGWALADLKLPWRKAAKAQGQMRKALMACLQYLCSFCF